jgi:hypothetical protein
MAGSQWKHLLLFTTARALWYYFFTLSSTLLQRFHLHQDHGVLPAIDLYHALLFTITNRFIKGFSRRSVIPIDPSVNSEPK